jgi:RNA polymerase sigma factor (sigma-70 family)
MLQNLTSFIGKLSGCSALNKQKNQEEDAMDDRVMTEQEFDQLVEKMRPRLMQMGREFFGSDTEAEEVVQETWLRAWNVRDKVMLTEAYVIRIARNCCVSMWRGQRTQVELAEDDGTAVTEITPQEEMEEKENSEWLQSRLQRLPKNEREVWQMFYDDGLTVEEIAEERNISVATVRKTISNVRSRLRKDIRRHFFGLRHLIILLLVALVTGITVAAIVNPQGRVRGVMEKMLRIPEDTTICDIVEVMPSYHDDIGAFYSFIMSEMHYPDSAIANKIEGRVVVRFVVEKDGTLTHFSALNSPDESLSNEAIRVIKLTEPWHPAQNKGKTVRCWFHVPVNFRLN